MVASQPTIRVMVIEDDPGTRGALAAILGGSPGFSCVGAYRSAELALGRITQDNPQVILVDLDLPGMNGVEFLRACRSRHQAVELLVLTVHDEASWIMPALEAGASGYVVKGTPPARLLEAIAEVHGGGSFMSSQVARLVMRQFRRPTPGPVSEESLSPREQEVLQLLARGLHYAEIAKELGISPRTVNTHLHRVYEKLHVHSAAGAVGKLLQRDHQGR
jgi:DNA-binding NarL/FixJ family response regulator